MSEWSSRTLEDIAEFNPRESLKKGEVAVKVSMDKLQPFCRDIPEREFEAFSGGAKFRNRDTIMARITPCLENGKTAMVDVLEEGKVGFGSTEYIVFRAKPGITDPYFLYYLVCSPMVREPAIKSMVGSSGRQRVQTDVIQKLQVDIPSLSEQKRIGDFLKRLDDKIKVNNQINRNLQEQLKAIFDAWFYKMEPFGGEEPKGTEYIPLEKLCVAVTKGTTPTTLGMSFTDEGINFIKGETILDNHGFDRSKLSFISEDTHEKLKRSQIENGDIVFTIAGTLGRFALVDESMIPANTNQAVAIIRSKCIAPEYLYSFFLGNWHNDYYTKRIQQAVQANLSLGTIKSLPIAVLPKVYYKEYLDIIKPLIRETKRIEAENMKLIELRDSLLPRLMSGELDVSDLDI